MPLRTAVSLTRFGPVLHLRERRCDLLKRNQQESDAIKLAQRIIDAFEECSETTTAERLLDGKEGARLKKLVKHTPQKSVSASSSPNSAMAGAHSPACTCSVV